MINLLDYSYKEVTNILNLMNISYTTEGTGYVYEQSISEGNDINDTVVIKIKEKYLQQQVKIWMKKLMKYQKYYI